ncbi:unnamed protein product [Caenorhabditis nigoni]
MMILLRAVESAVLKLRTQKQMLLFGYSCLVIRYSEPPACACKALKLDSSNIKENQVKDNDLYDFVLSSTIGSPEILIDDCFVQVYCEGESELYIFDIDKGAKLGEYSLDGFCDPYQQQWQVDTGNGIEQFKELKGVCVLKKTEKFSPMDPSTLLIAYSNDLENDDQIRFFYDLDQYIQYYSIHKFAITATVRFDTKTKEDIVFHEGGVFAASYRSARLYMQRQEVDPSQRFNSSETGSDVLDMLERFIDTNRPNICGSMIIILMKRSPNEIEIARIVEKVREYRIHLSIGLKIPSSGGLHPETISYLVAEWIQCYFE